MCFGPTPHLIVVVTTSTVCSDHYTQGGLPYDERATEPTGSMRSRWSRLPRRLRRRWTSMPGTRPPRRRLRVHQHPHDHRSGPPWRARAYWNRSSPPSTRTSSFDCRAASTGPTVFVERLDRHRLDHGWRDLPVNSVFEVHDAKITVWRDYFDLMTAAKNPRNGDPSDMTPTGDNDDPRSRRATCSATNPIGSSTSAPARRRIAASEPGPTCSSCTAGQ